MIFENLATVIRRGLEFAFWPIAESASHHITHFCYVFQKLRNLLQQMRWEAAVTGKCKANWAEHFCNEFMKKRSLFVWKFGNNKCMTSKMNKIQKFHMFAYDPKTKLAIHFRFYQTASDGRDRFKNQSNPSHKKLLTQNLMWPKFCGECFAP